MAVNRFLGLPTTTFQQIDNAKGRLASDLEAARVCGQLSENGLGLDTTFGEDYSVTATFASYIFTKPTDVYGCVLQLADHDIVVVADDWTGSDPTRWLGKTAALGTGISVYFDNGAGTRVLSITPVGSTITTIGGLAAISSGGFYEQCYTKDATTTDNIHAIVAHIWFPTFFGCAVRCLPGQRFGLYLNDNFSAVTQTTFGGIVYGQKVVL